MIALFHLHHLHRVHERKEQEVLDDATAAAAAAAVHHQALYELLPKFYKIRLPPLMGWECPGGWRR